MNYQTAILEEYRRRGWHPARVSLAQQREVALYVRTMPAKIRDAARAAGSIAATSLGFLLVPDKVFEARQAQCKSNECGSYSETLDGQPVCNRCGCSGRGLLAKQHDQRMACPAINRATSRPYWDRYTGLSVSAKKRGT